MKKILFFAGMLISGSLCVQAQSQLLGGNAYLQGQYVEVGINQCGGWGTTNSAPTGYHARSGTNINATGDGPLNLGFVADPDKDGWTTGSPSKYNGDYFLPANPWVGWGVSFNGSTYATERTSTSNTACANLGGYSSFSGSNTSVTTSGGQSVATWKGTNGGLELQKIVSVKSAALYFTIQIQLAQYDGHPDDQCILRRIRKS